MLAMLLTPLLRSPSGPVALGDTPMLLAMSARRPVLVMLVLVMLVFGRR